MTGPTILTMFRMFLSVLFIIIVLLPGSEMKLIALMIFIIASVTDFIDGRWARKKKIVTDLGAFLDPLADKMLVNLAFLALVYLGVVPLWVFAVILTRDFAVDGMRMMAARTGVTISASFCGKLKTMTQMIALTALLLNLIINQQIVAIFGNVVLYLSLALVVYSGYDYLIKSWKKTIRTTKKS